ncbi:MAG: hypothetical protein P1V20_31810, partial [Verrucomicrobiales bacterium]|nr:hypothetical protein [Verrucomicrobiales bacterium]
LYAKQGEIVFSISHGKEVDRVSLSISDQNLPYIATFAKEGLSLSQGDRTATAEGRAVGRHPQEDLCIGHDDKNPVDSQAPKGNFTGSIDRVLVKLK